MERYVATFHTHVAALMSARALGGLGINARMAPVPRQLSSSCGTCVLYSADDPQLCAMDEDVEAVYRQTGEKGYEPLFRNL